MKFLAVGTDPCSQIMPEVAAKAASGRARIRTAQTGGKDGSCTATKHLRRTGYRSTRSRFTCSGFQGILLISSMRPAHLVGRVRKQEPWTGLVSQMQACHHFQGFLVIRHVLRKPAPA